MTAHRQVRPSSVEQISGAQGLELGDLGLPGSDDGGAVAPAGQHLVQTLRAGDGVEHFQVAEQRRHVLGARLGDQQRQNVDADLERLDARNIGGDNAHAADARPSKRGRVATLGIECGV